MEYKTKKNGNATAEIVIKNSPEEVNGSYQRAYEKAGKKIKVPGFRTGKAPLDMVERFLGDSVMEDAANLLIADTFQQIVKELDPAPYALPSFEIEEFDREKGAQFKGIYDTFPEVKLGKYKKVKAVQESVVVNDASVESQLKRLQSDKARLKSRDDQPAQTGDHITLTLQIKENTKTLYTSSNYSFIIGEGDKHFPELDTHVTGMRAGESKSYEQNIDVSFPDPKYAGKNLGIEMSVTNLSYTELPEINDEFAKEIDNFENLDALKKRIRDDLVTQGNDHLKRKTEDSILEQIVKDSKIILPDSMVQAEFEDYTERIKERLGSKDLTLANIASYMKVSVEKLTEEFKENATKVVMNRVCLSEIAKKEDIKVSPEELELEMKNRWAGYLSPAQLENLMKNENIQDEIRGQLLYRKMMEWLYENGEIKTGDEVSIESLLEQGPTSSEQA